MQKNAAQYFQAILDNLTGGLISVDMAGRVVYMNPMAAKILRLDEEHKCLGCDYPRAYADFPALLGVVKDTLESGKTVRRAEISILHANVPLIIGYSTLLVKDPSGTQLGIAVIFQDISFTSTK